VLTFVTFYQERQAITTMREETGKVIAVTNRKVARSIRDEAIINFI
jgi:hypothetical protein